MRANAARLAFGGCQSPASIAFIYGNGELPLLKPSNGAILPPNLLESGEFRFIGLISPEAIPGPIDSPSTPHDCCVDLPVLGSAYCDDSTIPITIAALAFDPAVSGKLTS